MTTWRREIENAQGACQDQTPIIACTLTDAELDVDFDDGYGGTEGTPFTAWSEKRVYFPICYDGSEWVGSAPRNPCDEKLEHQGGG